MHEYTQSTTIEAEADDVFDFVSDVQNLPDYLPTVQAAEKEPGGRVRVQGEAAGHPYNSDGYFRVDAENRRIEWGSEGEDKYSGWLTVEPNESSMDNVDIGGAVNCLLTVHISFEPRPEMEREFPKQGDLDAAMNEGIRETLLSIKNECEGHGGKVESRTATRGNPR